MGGNAWWGTESTIIWEEKIIITILFSKISKHLSSEFS